MSWNFLNRPWPAILWTVIIIVLMTIPASSIPSHGLFGIPHLDKVVHSIMFGILVYLWSRYTFLRSRNTSRMGILLMVCLLCCAFGTGMEFFQKYFVPTRSFEVEDIVADSIGSFAAWLYCRFYFPRKYLA